MSQTRQNAPDTASAQALTPSQFDALRDRLAEFSGVHLDPTRQRQLEHGLAQRLRATADSLAAYERRLHGPDGRAELQRLAELVLNHETAFFRNAPHFKALRDVLLQELHQRKPPGAPIRIWSAGCATGEEAYSLAITAIETLGWPLAHPVEIWATDLSAAALQKARAACYRGRTLQQVPPETLQRYFEPCDGGYRVGERARALVRFEQINLLEPFPAFAQTVDLIFCQNVTIYFQLTTCQQLIARFYDCLPPAGLLFLGFSETLWNVFAHFYSREVAGAYVYYKEALEIAPLSTRVDQAHTRPATATQAQPGPSRPPRLRRAEQAIVSHNPGRPFYNQAALRQPQPPSDLAALDHGQALLEQGRFEDALQTLRHISPQSAHAPRALTLIARAHADRGDLDLAIAEILRAIEIEPLHQEAYLLLGLMYGRQGQLALAVHQLERARYLSADSAVISFYLAEAYRQAGRTKKAAQEYRNTLLKLDKHPPGELLHGVAVGWIRETCQRQIEYLPR